MWDDGANVPASLATNPPDEQGVAGGDDIVDATVSQLAVNDRSVVNRCQSKGLTASRFSPSARHRAAVPRDGNGDGTERETWRDKMTTLRTSTVLAAMLILAAPVRAEETHHSGAPADAPPAAAEPEGSAIGKMTGSNMMMSGGSPSHGMPDGMMKMMMGMMAGGEGPMGQMMSPERVEGRIAFLGTELKLAEAQRPLWNAVADALRANARAAKDMMSEMPAGMMMSMDSSAGTPIERIELHEKMLSARLEGLARLKAALRPFYTSLDETQKALADKLLMPAPMGMM